MAVSPLLESFRRGELDRDVRMLAAQGGLAPRAYEQLGILVLLLRDQDEDIRIEADKTLKAIPVEKLRGLLARSDVPSGMREVFERRNVMPADAPALDADLDAPLIEVRTDDDEELDEIARAMPEGAAAEEEAPEAAKRLGTSQQLAAMKFPQKLKAAVKGNREMRAVLIRDPNKLIATSVLSSPKVSESEIASFAKMQNVSDEVLRTIATNRAWTKNYSIVLALTKNPKTPVALSMNLMQRLTDKDLSGVSVDRNVPEALRIAARKKVVSKLSK